MAANFKQILCKVKRIEDAQHAQSKKVADRQIIPENMVVNGRRKTNGIIQVSCDEGDDEEEPVPKRAKTSTSTERGNTSDRQSAQKRKKKQTVVSISM